MTETQFENNPAQQRREKGGRGGLLQHIRNAGTQGKRKENWWYAKGKKREVAVRALNKSVDLLIAEYPNKFHSIEDTLSKVCYNPK